MLSNLYREAEERTDEDTIDGAREEAISLLVDAGYDTSSSDALGEPIGDSVQTHLMIALMRAPRLIDVLERRSK